MVKDNNQNKLKSRLNARLIAMRFFAFLWLDIVLIVLLAAGGLMFAERTVSNVAFQITEAPAGSVLAKSREERRQVTLGNVTIRYKDSVADGLPMPLIEQFFPENTREAERNFSYDAEASNLKARLHPLSYIVSVPDGEGGYTVIELNLGRPIGIAQSILCVFLIFQLISLIHMGVAGGRAIRKTLAPLRELLAATQALAGASKSPSGRYSPEALKNLARALEAVGAGHLDRRIPSEVISDELKPLAAAINDMLNRIDEAYGAQIRFVSDASHELRTPIAVIQGYANMLSRWGSEDPATLRESIEAIKSEAASMKQMVNQLLFLARGDSASMKLDRQTLNLSVIASEVIKEELMIDESHVFKSHIEEGVFIEGDAGLIKQLFRILLDNSIKYTNAGGIIAVKLAMTPPEMDSADDVFANGRVLLTVQDEGVGIPAHILPHIFDRFVRADESRTRNTGGAGLGLSIAKWIAERHGGYMEVLSHEGIGSRFTVVLPAASPHQNFPSTLE
jgi:signal transduction histidine kinase